MNEPKEFEKLSCVKEVVEIDHSYADYGVITNCIAKEKIRVLWLQDLRENWEWRGDHVDEVNDEGFIQFREKNE